MKRLLLIICFLLILTSSYSQSNLFYDTFNYSAGSLTTNSGGVWTNNSGTANQLQVSAGSLTYSGYWPSTSDGKIDITTTGTEDVKASFATTSGNSTTVYASFLVNSSAAATTGAYFAHFISGTTYKGRVWAKSNSTGFDIGLSSDGSTTTYTGNVYTFNTTYLIVVSYTFNAGTNDDVVNLWVNPSLSSSTPPTPTIGPLVVAGDYSNIAGFGVRQNGSTAGLTASIDGLKIGTSWGTSVLPVTLTSFTGKTSLYGAELNWSTASEQNNSHFEILRSADGQSFSKIGQVAGSNNSSQTKSYTYTDKSPDAGTSYYQLKQVDFDGNFKIYGPVAVKSGLATAAGLKVFASVSSLELTLHTSAVKNAIIGVYDMSGHLLHKASVLLSKGLNTFSVPSNIPQGLYFVSVIGSDLSLQTKFIKQ